MSATLILFTARWTIRQKRVLTHGFLVSAKVISRASTSHHFNGYKMARVTFAFEWDGQPYTGRALVTQSQIAAALRYIDNDLPVRLLVDANKPTRVFWIEGLLHQLV